MTWASVAYAAGVVATCVWVYACTQISIPPQDARSWMVLLAPIAATGPIGAAIALRRRCNATIETPDVPEMVAWIGAVDA